MIIYLLKFSACLAIFMVLYKLILEKSSIHQFKRFYLLGALVFALIIPTITFIEYVEPVNVEGFATYVVTDFDMTETTPEIIEVDYTPIILWSIYGLGVLIFLLKFCFNLNNIISRIRSNPKLKSGSFINVLVSNLKIPHTFFNYIFFNKHKFELGDIPKEVLIHEQTHAKQKHSIDVLLLELLQIIFWFNPLIYLLKREVKLNHEYLADQAVLNKGIKPSTYKTILLAFSSNAQHQELANAINYSSIKKRFTVMNTHTSKTSIWLRSLLILPVLATLLYSFTERKQIEKEVIDPGIIELYLNKKGELLLENDVITFEDIKVLYQEDPKLQISIKIFPDAKPNIAKNITSKLKNIGIKKMTVCTSRAAEFENYGQEKATDKEISAYNAWAKKLKEKFKNLPESEKIEGYPVILNDVEFRYFNSIYDKMSNDQRKVAESIPEAILEAPELPLRAQDKATPEQIEEYNQLAKKYNEKPLEQRIIKLKDYERLKYLYKLMSDSQKKSAQPLPKFPPPPPPAPSKTVYKHKYTWILLNSKGQFFVNDELGSLDTIEKEIQKIAKTKSKEIVFKYDKNAQKELVDKVNGLIETYGLKNIYDTLPPPPPPPTAPVKKGNGPNGSDYYPIPPAIPENASPEQRKKMQAAIDDFEKTYKRKVHQIKSDSGVTYNMIVDDQEYGPSKQNDNHVKTGFIKIHGTPHYFVTINDFTKYYNKQGFEVNKQGTKISKSQVNASNVVPGQYITKVYSDSKLVAQFYDNKPNTISNTIDIPSPPKPISSLDFIIDLAKKNAVFFYEKEQITSDKAIELIKNNKELNIQATKTESKQPKVFISKEPISFNRGKSETPVMVNGKTPKDDLINLSKKELLNLELTLKNSDVVRFKFKTRGKPSCSVTGNKLNRVSKSLAKQAKEGTQIQLYDIKDSDGHTHPPIIITITNKLIGVMGKKN
ncbi:M56 family metallopeptidase [Psychroserpens damuponensis]|uniref:M56 family metallopeptidase n=1 Tax=Psychroserpens damuponensis TaxID=943936 RepID=UPI000A034A54|nr:M56 family metallopeptidase [Psychroserpens damuponensis]